MDVLLPAAAARVPPPPRLPVLRQQRRRYPQRFTQWPTNVDSSERLPPKRPDLDGNFGTLNFRNEIHSVMGWMDPTIWARKTGRLQPHADEDGRPTGGTFELAEEEDSAEPRYTEYPATKPEMLLYSDIGTVYRLSDDDMRAYFQEGFAGQIVKAFAPPMQPRGFLYRKLDHLLNTYIGKMKRFQDPKVRDVLYELRDGKAGFILDGPHGCGKSALLNQVVHYARSRGMLVFFINDAEQWTCGSFVVPSTVLPGFFDNPNETLELLRNFCKMDCNKQILQRKKLSRVYPVPSHTGRKPPETVWDLLTHAFDDIETTPVVFKYFLDELIAIKDIPIVFVVDSFDRLCKHTEYFNMHPDVLRDKMRDDGDIRTLPKERIHASRLTLVRALSYVMAANEPNKLVVGATCRMVGTNAQSTHEFSTFFPGEDTMLHPMEVAAQYDDYELRAILRFYLETMEGVDAHGRTTGGGWSWRRLELPGFERTLYKIKFVTDANPYMVWHQSEMRQYWKFEYSRQRQLLARTRQRMVEDLELQRKRMLQ